MLSIICLFSSFLLHFEIALFLLVLLKLTFLFVFVDLLERGKTTGETVRYLLSPNLRPKKEDPTHANEKRQSVVKGEAEDEPSEFSYREGKEVLDSPDLDRSQYNMVIYGLPNIIVIQQ